MSRATDRWQNQRIDDLDRRVQDLEGEVSVRQDHRMILYKLSLILDECARLDAQLRKQDELMQCLVEFLEPKGSVVINVGAISEIN